ncbi:uncharacterized protein LOC108210387 isoform X1 [Daucus carota subsp. sativus]|uniref:RING-type E3 ubiquitin transferase n=4 Tax=Daucus carota subsp. sativus TaxID=79200 RepID=A0A161WS09_DAUCS|nr:PREDICTED: uncharacterized protein LOC108210387 isoform X1 [Daucus carota subsp. sativus]
MMLSSVQSKWPHTCILVLLILYKLTVSASKSSSVSYLKHCASVVPEATPTTYNANVSFPYLRTLTSFIKGNQRIFRRNSFYTSLTSVNFHSVRDIYETDLHGVYKIDAELSFSVYSNNNIYDLVSNSTHGRSSRRPRMYGQLIFLLHGFWSESSGKGCFIGSAPWYSSEGEPLNLEVMFKLNFSMSSTYSNSFVTGELKSLSHLNDESYFSPISILSFPEVTWYEYKLISEENLKGFNVFNNTKKRSVLGSQTGEICSIFNRNYITFNLEYASSCSSSLKNCSLLDGKPEYRPTSVSLHSIQCNEYENKMRFLVHLTNSSRVGGYEMFDPSTTLFGEGFWYEKTNSLVLVACKISSSNSFGDAHVGDCSFRLSLYYPSVWSIEHRDRAAGHIWTNKTAEDVGYFGMINFRTSDACIKAPSLKYEYTEIEKVNKFFPKKAVTREETFPTGHYHDMRFDMSVPNSEYFGWGSAEPIFIGDESYADFSVFIQQSRQGGFGKTLESQGRYAEVVSHNIPLNISYKLIFFSNGDAKLGAGHSSLNTSLNSFGQLVISAEGVYDAETGHLCMVGCRNLVSNNLLDCDILLNFQFSGSMKTQGGLVKGSMQSTREQSDELFFQHLNITSSRFSDSDAERSLWRIDLEITMILISNMNACIFVCFQLYHVKRYPSTVPYMSLVMLVILTLAHMVPLVLNFEAQFLRQHTRNIYLNSYSWLEVNEVIVRVAKMVAFLLQFQLLRLAWTARHTGDSNQSGISVAERKTLLVSLPIYIVGGMVAFFLKSTRNSHSKGPLALNCSRACQQQQNLWGDFIAYASLILDGFLFPQVLLNIFQMSRRSALSTPFVLGTTFVHSIPHAYHLYQAKNYVPAHDGPDVYVNRSAELYSSAWDIISPLVSLLLVAIIFLQQRYGGRFFLPKKFQGVEIMRRSVSN